jgi:hypothetical protein
MGYEGWRTHKRRQLAKDRRKSVRTTAGPVTVYKADGSVEVHDAYGPDAEAWVLAGAKVRRDSHL